MSSVYVCEKRFDQQDFFTNPLAAGEYEDCQFINCNFSDADLSKIRFIESEFIDCNFSNATLRETAFQDVRFNRCKMLGLRFEDCDQFVFAVEFKGCQLNHASFYQMKLNRVVFQECQLHGVDFIETNLGNVSLQHCDFLDASFENTNLEKADLRGSTNFSINPEVNIIRGAKFSQSALAGLLEQYQIKIDPAT